jgi:hypothetical protein
MNCPARGQPLHEETSRLNISTASSVVHMSSIDWVRLGVVHRDSLLFDPQADAILDSGFQSRTPFNASDTPSAGKIVSLA